MLCGDLPRNFLCRVSQRAVTNDAALFPSLYKEFTKEKTKTKFNDNDNDGHGISSYKNNNKNKKGISSIKNSTTKTKRKFREVVCRRVNLPLDLEQPKGNVS